MYRRLRATGRVADGDPFVAPIHDATLNDDASDATAPVDAATLECELCHSVLPSRVQLHHSMLPPQMQAAPLNAATLDADAPLISSAPVGSCARRGAANLDASCATQCCHLGTVSRCRWLGSSSPAGGLPDPATPPMRGGFRTGRKCRSQSPR